MDNIASGDILISDPFLRDPNFMRSVVVICEHQPQGSFGFVLNKKYEQVLGDLIADVPELDFPVYYGGPVQLDTVHFLHRCPELISGGHEISKGIYWGGDFDEVTELLKEKKVSKRDIRFFIGYSGWSEGQLDEEMKSKSWIISKATEELIFSVEVDSTWKVALQDLGGEYQQMVNYPIDPQLN